MTGTESTPDDTHEAGADQDPADQLTQRLAELEQSVESDRHALRGDLATLIGKIEELAALGTGLSETRTIVETINDDLDHIVHRVAQLEAAVEERAASPRAGTPIIWHKLQPDLAAALWEPFTQWVVWLADTYALTVHQLPRCWYQHGGVIQELTALWTSWLSAHDRDKGDAGAAVYLWQDALGRALDRFSKWLGQCVNGSHKPRDRDPWSQDPNYLAHFAHLPESLRPAAPDPAAPDPAAPDPAAPDPAAPDPADPADPDPADPASAETPPPPSHPEGSEHDRH
ncbi:hypothetical protein [Spirillospora sp. CA-128828]|uniref:hypothetical protein n=1 Tax=Spirillospora sp. CA-128828 TaxID=3240033 RepID=UPI003D9235C8